MATFSAAITIRLCLLPLFAARVCRRRRLRGDEPEDTVDKPTHSSPDSRPGTLLPRLPIPGSGLERWTALCLRSLHSFRSFFFPSVPCLPQASSRDDEHFVLYLRRVGPAYQVLLNPLCTAKPHIKTSAAHFCEAAHHPSKLIALNSGLSHAHARRSQYKKPFQFPLTAES